MELSITQDEYFDLVAALVASGEAFLRSGEEGSEERATGRRLLALAHKLLSAVGEGGLLPELLK